MLRQRIGASGKTIAMLAAERRAVVRKESEEYAKANARK